MKDVELGTHGESRGCEMWSRRGERGKEQSGGVESGCVKGSVKGRRGKW